MNAIAKRHVNRVLKALRNERKRGSVGAHHVNLGNGYFLVPNTYDDYDNHTCYTYGFELVKLLQGHTLHTQHKETVDYHEFPIAVELISRNHPEYKAPVAR